MSKTFAIIVDNKVSNVALFESLEFAQQDVGDTAVLVEIAEGVKNPSIGEIWDGENFYPAPVLQEPVIEEPVIEEIPVTE